LPKKASDIAFQVWLDLKVISLLQAFEKSAVWAPLS